MIKVFYAVTTQGRVYQVWADGPYAAIVTDTTPCGTTKSNYVVSRARMAAISGDILQTYWPEKYPSGHSKSSPERCIELVPAEWHWWRSQPIIALLERQIEAAAFVEGRKPFHISSWADRTARVLKSIGNNHPSFYISSPSI